MSGRRPDQTKAFNFLTDFRDVGADWISMPGYFKQHAYLSLGSFREAANHPPPLLTIHFLLPSPRNRQTVPRRPTAQWRRHQFLEQPARAVQLQQQRRGRRWDLLRPQNGG